MKTAPFTFILIISICSAHAQSNSFQTLKNKFSESDNVNTFTASGFAARAVLWMGGENEFTRAIKQIKTIHIITIPQDAFEARGLSVRGFKKILHKDDYEELALFRDKNDQVSVYFQPDKKRPSNRYFVLIENLHEVVAFEIKGNMDPSLLQSKAELFNKN